VIQDLEARGYEIRPRAYENLSLKNIISCSKIFSSNIYKKIQLKKTNTTSAVPEVYRCMFLKDSPCIRGT